MHASAELVSYKVLPFIVQNILSICDKHTTAYDKVAGGIHTEGKGTLH